FPFRRLAGTPRRRRPVRRGRSPLSRETRRGRAATATRSRPSSHPPCRCPRREPAGRYRGTATGRAARSRWGRFGIPVVALNAYLERSVPELEGVNPQRRTQVGLDDRHQAKLRRFALDGHFRDGHLQRLLVLRPPLSDGKQDLGRQLIGSLVILTGRVDVPGDERLDLVNRRPRG